MLWLGTNYATLSAFHHDSVESSGAFGDIGIANPKVSEADLRYEQVER